MHPGVVHAPQIGNFEAVPQSGTTLRARPGPAFSHSR
jgi:hypothetical protein